MMCSSESIIESVLGMQRAMLFQWPAPTSASMELGRELNYTLRFFESSAACDRVKAVMLPIEREYRAS